VRPRGVIGGFQFSDKPTIRSTIASGGEGVSRLSERSMTKASAIELLTIGYEGTTLDHVLTSLQEAGATHLLDVRAVPQSRKPGFSKRQLSASLAEIGIDYTHLLGLGTPKPGRIAVRHGDIAAMHRIYDAHLKTPDAQADLARAIAIAGSSRGCLLCFERDHTNCHRAIVARLICEASGTSVRHLAAPLS
jgi:uncharacterized protein (DUF488 family)